MRVIRALKSWRSIVVAVLSLSALAFTAMPAMASGDRYVNLHQCVYSNGNYLYTNLLSNTPNTPFNTGTNVSDTRDTAPQCGPGAYGFTLNTANVSVQPLDLNPGVS